MGGWGFVGGAFIGVNLVTTGRGRGVSIIRLVSLFPHVYAILHSPVLSVAFSGRRLDYMFVIYPHTPYNNNNNFLV